MRDVNRVYPTAMVRELQGNSEEEEAASTTGERGRPNDTCGGFSFIYL